MICRRLFGLVLAFFCVISIPTSAIGELGSLNGRSIGEYESGEEFTFWVAGHIYGSPRQQESVYPASSFVANLARFNESHASHFILLGDNYWTLADDRVKRFSEVVNQLAMPVFNAPGNHDHPESVEYQQQFGSQTYGDFRIAGTLFLVLNTEIEPGRISGDQLEYVEEVLKNAATDDSVRNVMVFTHKLVWCPDVSPELSQIVPHLNDGKCIIPGAFKSTLESRVRQLAERKPVYWFSGDIGVPWSYTTFYLRDETLPLHFIATGIGGTNRDAVLKVTVNRDSEVVIAPVSLVGQNLQPVETYNVEFWKKHFAAKRAAATAAAKQAAAKQAAAKQAAAKQAAAREKQADGDQVAAESGWLNVVFRFAWLGVVLLVGFKLCRRFVAQEKQPNAEADGPSSDGSTTTYVKKEVESSLRD